MPSTDLRILAILTVRNEGAFLIDWLAHHKAAGFTDFLVFSNDCDDGTDTMLDRLEEMGEITHVRNDGPWRQSPQWDALKRADRHPLKAAADWVLFLDIDEFVNIHTDDNTVPALFSALPEATAIPLTWRLFGNAGIITHEDRPVTEFFTRAAPPDMHWPWRAYLFKTLFRNDGSYGKLGVHRPRQPDPERINRQRWFDGSGREMPPLFHRNRIFSVLGQQNYGLAQLNHYALGSMENYIVKCDRGRANRDAEAFDMSYWVERNFAGERDDTIAALASRSAPIRARLRADDVLGTLHDAAFAWRRERFAELMLTEPYRALYGRLTITPPSRPIPDEAAKRIAGFAQLAAETDAGTEGG